MHQQLRLFFFEQRHAYRYSIWRWTAATHLCRNHIPFDVDALHRALPHAQLLPDRPLGAMAAWRLRQSRYSQCHPKRRLINPASPPRQNKIHAIIKIKIYKDTRNALFKLKKVKLFPLLPTASPQTAASIPASTLRVAY